MEQRKEEGKYWPFPVDNMEDALTRCGFRMEGWRWCVDGRIDVSGVMGTVDEIVSLKFLFGSIVNFDGSS